MGNYNYKIEHQGIKGLKNIAAHVGIDFQLLQSRVYFGKRTIEEAIAMGKKSVVAVYEYKGVKGVPNIARANGIKVATLKARIASGMSIEEAVNTPLLGSNPKPRVPKAKKVMVKGIKHPTELNPLWKLALGMEIQ